MTVLCNANNVLRISQSLDHNLCVQVEAKKALPSEDHNEVNRVNGSIQGSPGLGGDTKKIFVGGLASTVTKSDFKKYFDQFGGITDVVVIYDHNTRRPIFFGFNTFDSEKAVDCVLHKTFHELNGRMVEVKRAGPKEYRNRAYKPHLICFNYFSYKMCSISSFDRLLFSDKIASILPYKYSQGKP